MERYPGHEWYFSWLAAILWAIPIGLVGLDLVAVRAVSLLAGLLLLAVCWRLGTLVGGRRCGFAAMLLVAGMPAFTYSAGLARPDMVVAAAGYGAMALIAGDRATGWSKRGALAGLLLALVSEMHPNALLFGPVLAIIVWAERGRIVLGDRRLWSAALTTALGPVLYVTLHVLPAPAAFFGITKLAFADTRTPPLLSPEHWSSALAAGLSLAAASALLVVPLALGGIALALRNHQQRDRMTLALGLGPVAVMVAALPYSPPYYAILLGPALAFPAVHLLDTAGRWLWARPENRGHWRLLPRVVASLTLFWAVGISFKAIWIPGDGAWVKYQAVIAKVRNVTPPGSRIMADPKYWFGLSDYPFVGLNELSYYRQAVPGSRLVEAFAAARPDVLVLDGNIQEQITDDVAALEPWQRVGSIPRGELAQILADHGEDVSAAGTNTDSTLRIYRLFWESRG